MLTEYQDEVEQNRSQGIAGAGGPVASEGESKYCEANNTDLGKWAEENKEAVATKKQELAGKKTCVYLQNSGLGNTINPLTSLCIPHDVRPLLIIGHRHTLPQHKMMGEIDEFLLGLIEYYPYIIVKGNNNVK